MSDSVDRKRLLLSVSADCVRAADEESGSEFATRVALERVLQARRDLALVEGSLRSRLRGIGAVGHVTPTPPLPPEDADVAAVRDALDLLGDNARYLSGKTALDRLTKRVQEAERERDEARRHSPHPVGDWFSLSRRAEAAEAREAVLREALKAVMEIGLGFREGSLESARAIARTALATAANPEATE